MRWLPALTGVAYSSFFRSFNMLAAFCNISAEIVLLW